MARHQTLKAARLLPHRPLFHLPPDLHHLRH